MLKIVVVGLVACEHEAARGLVEQRAGVQQARAGEEQRQGAWVCAWRACELG